MRPEPRPALGGRKAPRPHPASPESIDGSALRPTGGRGGAADGRVDAVVMLCVRVPRSLRRRVKLLAAGGGHSVQTIVTDALEAFCKQYDM